MTKKAIIHISDLHIMSNIDPNGDSITSFNSWFNCADTKKSDEFITSFIDIIKKKFKDYKLYLIISGDLADQSKEDEYIELKRILEKIITELSIDKKEILIIPGDHDVNWIESTNAYNSQGISKEKKAFEFHEQKFKFFTDFYNDFFKGTSKEFIPQKVIVDKLVIDEHKIIYIGFNSNFRIGAKSGLGYIDVDILEKELKEIETEYNEYSKIAVFHHNLKAFYDHDNKGQWEASNLITIKSKLENFQIKCYIYGNEHTPASEVINVTTHVSIGSLSMKNPIPNFKVLEIINDEASQKLDLLINCFEISNYNRNDIHNHGSWKRIDDNTDIGELKYIKLIEPLVVMDYTNSTDLPAIDEDEISTQKGVNKKSEIIIKSDVPKNYIHFQQDDEDHLKLLEIIKTKKIFHSGHFHWSETSRAHNWIDVSKILNDRNNLLDAKNFILNIIDKNKLEFDFIIGLGIEGNMLATRTSIIHDKPYTFLPYSYRYDDHSDFEKKLNFENDGTINTVLIITDVVHDGRTIRKLLHKKREDNTFEFFKKIEKVIVLSLFYTGELPKDTSSYHNLLNKCEEDEKFDNENDHIEERIQFHFVSHIKVETCPYTKDNYKTDCIIVKEGLSCIHKFYTEKPNVIK